MTQKGREKKQRRHIRIPEKGQRETEGDRIRRRKT
jgi:hypothetical protein